MSKKLPLLIVAVAYLYPSPQVCAQSDLCDCGPDTCLKDPSYPQHLSAKKAMLRSALDGFPEDLIALLDRDGRCVMAVDRRPTASGFFLITRTKPD